MKIYSLRGIVVALALALLALPGFAQDPVAGGYKIAVVDMQTLMADYDKREQMYKDLEKEVETRQQEIDALSNKIEGMKKDYDSKKRAGADVDSLLDLEEVIEREYGKYKAALDENQRVIDQREERVLREVLEDVQTVLNEVGTEGNYHLILNSRQGPRGSVVYFSTTIDITTEVLTRLNAKA